MKAAVATIVAFAILAIQQIFGIQVPEEVGGQITDAIVSIVTALTILYGIYKQFKKWRERSK